MFSTLPMPLVLRCAGFLAAYPRDISALSSTCSRFNVIMDLDCMWVASYSSRQVSEMATDHAFVPKMWESR